MQCLLCSVARLRTRYAKQQEEELQLARRTLEAEYENRMLMEERSIREESIQLLDEVRHEIRARYERRIIAVTEELDRDKIHAVKQTEAECEEALEAAVKQQKQRLLEMAEQEKAVLRRR